MQNTANSQKSNSSGSLKLYLLLSLGVFIALLVVSASIFSPDLTEDHIVRVEQQLQKQPLGFSSGEHYAYLYQANISGQQFNMTFTHTIMQYGNCTVVYVRESEVKTPTCLDRYGNDQNGSNLSLANPSIRMFQPWMLAVSDNWNWDTYVYLDFSDHQINISNASFRTAGQEAVFGRPAYKVIALYSSSTASVEVTYWVDVQKKILLKESGEDYVIELTDSSLPDNG